MISASYHINHTRKETINMPEIENWEEEYKDFNKDLEAKILEANNDDTLVKWNRLLPELMSAEVFMAGQFGEEMVAANGQKLMNILMLQKNGHNFIPFFTSPERLKSLLSSTNQTLDVMKIKLTDFFKNARGTPVVMNPATSYTRAFSPFDMKVLVAENEKPAEKTEK